MTSETEQAVERERATLLEWLANVNETWSAKELRIIASDAKRMIEAQAAALAHSEARERGLREGLTETVDALGQATGLLKACEDDIDINVVIAIRDGAGRIVRTLATLHSPTIIETGSAVLKRARAALTNKTEE